MCDLFDDQVTAADAMPAVGIAAHNGAEHHEGESSVRSALVTMGPAAALTAALGASSIATIVRAFTAAGDGEGGRRLFRWAAVGAVAAAAYQYLFRPWHLTWGATDRELHRVLPGDEYIPRPTSESTRAITIDAPAHMVWRWIVQLGQGRGGFYSYDWLENLAGLDIHSIDRIDPGLQAIQVGDMVPFGLGVGVPVIRCESNRALVLGATFDAPSAQGKLQGGPAAPGTSRSPDDATRMSWAFVLRPIDECRTRLIARFRFEQRPRASITQIYPLLIELPHFIMERKMLYGIRRRSHRRRIDDEG
jgi:hypothetical protein